MSITWNITWLETTPSTNDEVWERAYAGAPQGIVVAAKAQTQGRGQWQRTWVSPRGGLYFSFLLRPRIPEQKWPNISGEIASALTEYLQSKTGCNVNDIWVKEPNDILCNQGKLCGTSLESKLDGILVVGIGINLFEPEVPIVTDGRNTPAYLEHVAEQQFISDDADDFAKDVFIEQMLQEALTAIEPVVNLI